MTLVRDFEDFIILLNKHRVDYMVVGGYALALHGAPRHTGDLDIWIDISKENAARLMQVIQDFGMGSLGLAEDNFLKPGYITQIGHPPLRIDILNEIDGITFGDARKNRQQVDMDGLTLFYIGLQDFIRNKKASGRKRDLLDIRGDQRETHKTKAKQEKKGTWPLAHLNIFYYFIPIT